MQATMAIFSSFLPLMKLTDRRVVMDHRKRGRIKHVAHFGTPAPTTALATLFAHIAGQGTHPRLGR